MSAPTRNDGGALGMAVIASQLTGTPTTAAQEVSENTMWDMYLEDVKEDDKRITDAWIEDSNGVLAFVSSDPLVRRLSQ